jgi:hypothetical protein
MTGLHAVDSPVAQETLRPLSPYEHMFWAFDRVSIFNFSIACCLRGTIARAAWSAAFAEVQQRHPLLNASLNLDDPQAPRFVRGAGLPIPLRFVERTSTTEWQREMEAEMATPFDPSTAPFLRAVLVEDEHGCELILTAHHIVLDGMGMLLLLRELFAALSGETLSCLPAPPSADDRTAHKRSLNAASAQAPQAADNADKLRAELPPRPTTRCIGAGAPIISAVRLSQQETAQLLRCARREQTTVGSALLAAMASAVRTLAPSLETADIRFAAPIDVRSYLDNEADGVLSVINARGVSPYPSNSLWETARAIRSQLVAFQSFLEIDDQFNRVKGLMAMNFEYTALLDLLAAGFGHDVLLSNLKTVDLGPAPEGLIVEAVWGPSVLVGYEGEHMVGSSTFEGALHLVYTSRSPLPGLLDEVQHTLARACADA